ncbi:hypothetical protein PV325_008335 [Microctonus aethiopoides]|uniref:C2H2-type domain-containing protein n=1 Tax=Microctonus aethiopoides TaxID=144406 RepID=A0AA39FB14_9HYME|nr:hypothetical protein PV325_008335 [Microctonus aethiopoides]KAK0166099.1 hypothetical protein PV328_004546 [Microctonus aethiopoides]
MNKSYVMKKAPKMTMNHQLDIKNCIPRLKKNKKHELRWGHQYYTALQDAVFSIKDNCHRSSEMPVSLRENVPTSQKNFVCDSCNDSFYFQSSFEDHNNRYSWILGYWCNYCFHIKCNHKTYEKLSCLTCDNAKKSKLSKLRAKGLQRGQKVGEILLFYNQCQFFEHLKKHNINCVGMNDIMLMPLPHNIQRDEYSTLERVCKILMEYMFINKIHIMDWFRINKIHCKWWQMKCSDDNPIGELLKKYVDDCSKTPMTAKSTVAIGTNEKFVDENPVPPSVDEQSSESSEDDDNPCDTEISFVDCGPTRTYIINSEGNIIKPININKPSASLASISELNDLAKDKNINISTSTSQHPSNSVNNKKIIIISQKSQINEDKNSAENNKIKNIRKKDNVKINEVIMTPRLLVNSTDDEKQMPNIVSKNHNVVIPSGAKILFQQIQKPATEVSNVDFDDNTASLVSPKFNMVKNKIKIFPSKFTTPENNNSLLKKIPIVRENSKFINNNIKLKPLHNTESLIVKYRESMENNLQQSNKKLIQMIINNIKDVIRKYQTSKRCADIKNVTANNLIAIKKFENYLNNSKNSDANTNDDESINEEFNNRIREWESQYNKQMIKPECLKCRRKLRPTNYIIGISKPAVNEAKFCQCHNYICHLCNSKLGDANRYETHMRFHKRESPFVCPECRESFSSMFHLETHIWTKCFHIMTQQFFTCRICEVEGFLTMEDVTRHFALVHARNVVFCNECQRLFNSYSEYRLHYMKNHIADSSIDSSISDPVRFLICEYGRCLVKPENFHAHIHSHIEIDKVTYYTCPFCLFYTDDIVNNRQNIQNHILGKHAARLREVITLQTVKYLTGKFPLPMSQQYRYVPIMPAINIIPKNITANSKPSGAFEQASGSRKKSSILNKKSNKTNGNSHVQQAQNGIIIPKIVSVKSIIEDTNELQNNLSTSQVSPSYELNNSETKLHNDEEDEIVELPKLFVDMKSNTKTDVNCDGVKENNTNNSNADESEMNDVKVPLITEVETRNNTANAPVFKEENLNATHLLTPPPLKLQQQQQESSITEKNNISSADATLTITTVETKHKETRINELSNDNNKSDTEESPLNSETSSEPAKEKVTRKIMSNIQLSLKRKRRQRRPWRIALNGPNNPDIPPINYKCHLCNELISTSWSIVNSHFNANHSRDYKVEIITPMLTRLSANIVEIESKKNGRKRKLDSSIVTMKKRRRWAHKKFPDRPTSPSLGICIRQEPPLQDTEGNFKCKKCDSLFKNANILRDHVASNHRIRGHFLICLECGENFVVAPSLQMHLKAFHGITDPITYMAQNTAYAPDMTDELEAQERIAESNQCHVCMAVFEDKTALDKHFRVHGMAFLNRKRIEARNALRSPEKKCEITSTTLNTNEVGREIKKKNFNTEANNKDNVLPESDSANVNILTRISRLLS